MPMHHHDASEQLGKVSFPVSCAAGVAEGLRAWRRADAFVRIRTGASQFTEITKSDPSCAMAHWGIAMSLFHQIWERPQRGADSGVTKKC